MKNIFKTLSFILCIFIAVNSVAFAASAKPSSWAEKEVRAAIRNGVVPTSLTEGSYQNTISRTNLCNLLVTAYTKLVAPVDADYIENPFSDTDNNSVLKAYYLGIVSGVTENTFEPDRNVTRQEMAKMLCNTAKAMKKDIMIDKTQNLKIFADNGNISHWARTYVSSLVNAGVIKGDNLGNFNPFGSVTVEQAIIMLVRLAGFDDDAIPSEEMPIILTNGTSVYGNVNYYIDDNNAINLSWTAIDSAYEYTVEVIEKRNSRFPEDIPANLPYYYTVNRTNIGFVAHNKINYEINIKAGDTLVDSVKFTTAYGVSNSERKALVFPFGEFSTYEEAENNMTTIYIPVWQIKNGQKVSTTLPLKLNSAISDIVADIFDEIYNDEEQFPINSIGSYTWRSQMSSGRLSEHNYGTAIDINPDQNYCLYNDGSTVGSYWKPGEDPYSIDPYGIVIRTFEKYGFTWGGDSWTNPKDYMHFSYLGT